MSDFIDEELVGLNDVLKEIWRLDPWLNAQVPATDSDRDNLFFEDGLGRVDRPDDLPRTFASLNDEGVTVVTKASGRVIEYRAAYTIRIGSPSKALTRQLASVFTGHIERVLRGQRCNLGEVGAYRIENIRELRAESGLRLWIGQLTATIHGRLPWQMPLAVPA